MKYTILGMDINIEDLWDDFWRDKNGKVVVWQMPNVFLIGWAVLTFASILVSGKTAVNTLSWAGLASLVVWSLLEILKGANYFRKLLGLIVLVLAVLSLVHTITG